MAKLNIISDFSALKGKISFSDKEPVSKAIEKKVSPPSVDKNERILKVGQKVVLMDSDLRGRIVSLGRTVSIELEGGLTVMVGYDGFALTDDDEISALRQAKVEHKKIAPAKRSVSSAAENTLLVDLHIEAIPGGHDIPEGLQLQFQMETFRKVIRRNLPHKGMKISFIHGIGDGILKAAIRKELDEVLALRCSYSVGDPAVTIVSIK